MFHYSFNIPGVNNEHEGQSEDSVFTYHFCGDLGIGVADGAGCSTAGAAAAKSLAKAVTMYLTMNAEQLSNRSDDVVRQEVLALIRYEQDRLMDKFGLSREELGCMLAVGVLRKDLSWLAVNLGGCAVLGREIWSKPAIVLRPENEPCTTALPDEALLARIGVGRGTRTQSLAVGTDGLATIFWDRSGQTVYERVNQMIFEIPKDPIRAGEDIEESVYDLATDDAAFAMAIDAKVHMDLFRGTRPERYAAQRRRSGRKFFHYLELRDRGCSHWEASSRVGWKRSAKRNLRYLQDLGLA